MARISNMLTTGGLFRDLNIATKIYEEKQQFDCKLCFMQTFHRFFNSLISSSFLFLSFPQALEVFSIAGPHGSWQSYTFNDIINAEYQPTSVGQRFGPTWSTHWFRVKMTIPASWQGKEVHFRWGSGCEAMIYRPDGSVIQGISPGYREEYIVTKNFDGTTQPDTFYVEMACNSML